MPTTDHLCDVIIPPTIAVRLLLSQHITQNFIVIFYLPLAESDLNQGLSIISAVELLPLDWSAVVN